MQIEFVGNEALIDQEKDKYQPTFGRLTLYMDFALSGPVSASFPHRMMVDFFRFLDFTT